jgi:hypothetical protein
VKDRDQQNRKVFASDWEHAWRAREKQYDADKWDTNSRALFGCHLLAKYPQAVVNVVESEKTALIMATRYGDFDKQLWLACGGLNFLKLDMLQPLVDQGRTVWLWPDKDGADKWQTVADNLGYDKCHVYTRFFDTCWRDEDGPKADCADIIIRMMATGDKPRHTGDGQGATDQNATASDQSGATPTPTPDGEPPTDDHEAIMKAVMKHVEIYGDEPFLDDEEVRDPRVREWRRKCSIQSSGWGKWPTSRVADVKTAADILKDNPLIKKLFEIE